MVEPSKEEVRELLVGAWTSIALIVDAIVCSDLMQRSELIQPLIEAEMVANDRRRVALAAVRKLVEMSSGEVRLPDTRRRSRRNATAPPV